jgi:hypothetical protein
MNRGELISFLLIIAGLSLALLIADRFLRISTYIEPFTQCGVDMQPCEYPLQCINGYCKSVNAPRLPHATGLPVVPS